MADIFLSYARADAETAYHIRQALEELGLTVFFDTVNLDAGDVFPEKLKDEITNAGVVISCWNTHALTREWVVEECNLAREQNKLIPVQIGEIDEEVLTVAYSKIDRRDLSDFSGDPGNVEWQRLVRTLERRLGRHDLLKLAAKRAEDARKATAAREKERARLAALERRTKELEKRKRGLRPWQWSFLSLVVLVLASGAAWYGLSYGVETGEDNAEAALRDSIIPPEVQARMAELDVDSDTFGLETLEDILIDFPVARLVEASAIGDEQASLLAGWAFHYGKGGLSENPQESVRYYRRACNQGAIRGCLSLGLSLAEGRGAEQDLGAAVQLYREACDAESGRGCAFLGTQYSSGEGVVQDSDEAVRLFRKACDAGSGLGCTNLGFAYANGDGVAVNSGEAIRLYKLACDLGNVRGCANLGTTYMEGAGADQDLEETLRLLRLGCDHGFADSCNNLGSQLAQRRGVENEMVEAARLFRKACDGDDAQGCGNLGKLYEKGDGVDLDWREAARLYGKACSIGNSPACERRSVIDGIEDLIESDMDEGRAILVEGCDRGSASACQRLRHSPF